MIATMVFGMGALFVAAQGAAVFGTAYLALRLLKASHWLAKLVAITISYVAWVTVTISAYVVTGGDLGMMDGGLFVAGLCFTALMSSVAFLLLWILWAPIAKAAGVSRSQRQPSERPWP